ncbi:nucleotide sugar dehydrogenase [Alphaproteobacteria bacterium]|nr:nucleotide sugar dehydrogenase [Alphaproteobacteria bacterium]
MEKVVIGFAGLTHLGVNSLAAAAERGFEVIGFDENSETVDGIASGRIEINEDGLMNLLEKNSKRITYSADPGTLSRCDIVYISIDVPTDDEANSDLKPIEAAINHVLESIYAETILVILCQVPPGFSRKIQQRHHNTYYQVETLVFGRAVERALFPERYIVGCVNPENVDAIFLQHLEAYDCPILPMRFESAELCKTAINLFLAATVSTANTLADICERIGADWSEITPSLRLDHRIGQYAYVETGLGLSGGNIERDLRTVQRLGEMYGANLSVVDACIAHSKYRKQWVTDRFEEFTQEVDLQSVGVLGLSYKEGTHSIKNSPSIEFITRNSNYEIKVFDPVVKKLPKSIAVKFCDDPYDVAIGVDVLLVCTAWPEFKSLNIEKLTARMRNKIIIDPFNLLKNVGLNTCTHIILGKV